MCDRYSYPVIISLLGNTVMGIALLVVGPAPFLTFAPSRELLFGCGALIGFGYALVSETHMKNRNYQLSYTFNIIYRQLCLHSAVQTMLLWRRDTLVTSRLTLLWQVLILYFIFDKAFY